VAAAHTDVYFLLPVAALTMPGVDSDLLSTVHNLTEGRSIQRSQNARIRVGWLSPGQDPAATLMTLVQLHAASLPFTPCAPSAGQQGGSGGGQTQEAAQEAMAQVRMSGDVTEFLGTRWVCSNHVSWSSGETQ
jgi:hypothetical protein